MIKNITISNFHSFDNETTFHFENDKSIHNPTVNCKTNLVRALLFLKNLAKRNSFEYKTNVFNDADSFISVILVKNDKTYKYDLKFNEAGILNETISLFEKDNYRVLAERDEKSIIYIDHNDDQFGYIVMKESLSIMSVPLFYKIKNPCYFLNDVFSVFKNIHFHSEESIDEFTKSIHPNRLNGVSRSYFREKESIPLLLNLLRIADETISDFKIYKSMTTDGEDCYYPMYLVKKGTLTKEIPFIFMSNTTKELFLISNNIHSKTKNRDSTIFVIDDLYKTFSKDVAIEIERLISKSNNQLIFT